MASPIVSLTSKPTSFTLPPRPRAFSARMDPDALGSVEAKMPSRSRCAVRMFSAARHRFRAIGHAVQLLHNLDRREVLGDHLFKPGLAILRGDAAGDVLIIATLPLAAHEPPQLAPAMRPASTLPVATKLV
jgi:hypothetical protein